MKTSILIALLVSCVSVQAQGDRVGGLLVKGRMAEKSGDVAAARAAYTEALRLQPSHPHALYHLKELDRNAASIAARGRAKKLEGIRLPAIDFQQAGVTETLQVLGHLIEKAAKDDYSPNFLVKDPSNKLEGREINLKLKNLPAKTVLDLILDQAGAKATFDEHAIVVTPR